MDVLIRHVTPETKTALTERAKARGRSLQAELLDVLERAAAEPPEPSARQTLDLALGQSRGKSTWGRDEIYETGR